VNLSTATDVTSFRIDLANLCLWRSSPTGSDERIGLTPKTFDVLRYFVEHPGRLVTHDELLAALWPGVHVQPEVLKSHILAIRNALGDKTSSPRYIETQRGRGYRFIGAMGHSPAQNRNREVTPELGLFAGRDELLVELATRLGQATAGERQAIFVSGEAGIGKTTLVEQFLSTASVNSRLQVARGHCIEGFAGAEPYYPVLEALREMCKGEERAEVSRAVSKFAPSWQAQIPEHASLEQQSRLHHQAAADARSRMLREACGLFEALASERVFVLVLEDLHWADFATIDFISALCRRRSSARLLLIATYRSACFETTNHPLEQMIRDLALRRYCSEMELTPLSEDATALLLTGDGAPTEDSIEFCRFIRRHTGGNPLFMRETLEFLALRGDVVREGAGWRSRAPLTTLASETPPTLQKAIEARIDGLTAGRRQVLEAASVAGLTFDPATVARAAGMDEQAFESVCEDLSRQTGVIQRDELLVLPNDISVRAYAFNHAVYRQVLYDRIGQLRRTQLHRDIAERLEEIYPPDRRGGLAMPLAEHFASARDWSRALKYLRQALRVASIRYARRDVLRILDFASEVSTNLPDSARTQTDLEFLERRGAIQAATYDPEAEQTYRKLAEQAARHGDIDVRCRALVGLGYVVGWHDLAQSLKILDQVIELSSGLADPIQRDVMQISAYTRRIWGSGWNAADVSGCEEALTRIRDGADPIATARAQINFSMMCIVSTRYQYAYDLVHSSYRILSESPDQVIEFDIARAVWMRRIGVPWSQLSLGKFSDALGEFTSTIENLQKNGDPSMARSFQVYRGILLFHAMDFEGVLADCAEMVSDTLQSDAAASLSLIPGERRVVERRIALIFSGLSQAAMGHNAAANDLLLTAAREMESQPGILDWYWRLPLEWGMVGILISTGDLPAATARAERLCELAMQSDERTWQALAWEARARVAVAAGKAMEAVGHSVKALAICGATQVPLANWRVHAACAAAYRASGEMVQAKAHTRLGLAAGKQLAASLPEGPRRLKLESRSAAFFAA
jgi:DNA-binding winged helix-turn-helix (wHTH) protein